MKIATWNVERLKHRSSLDTIVGACEQADADILILTETDERICPSYKTCIKTPSPSEIAPGFYAQTENRVSIYTNYPVIRQHTTFDRYTAVCVELATDFGPLLVYGTIIGVFGNRHPSFGSDLEQQLLDITRLAAEGSLCIAGDYNLSFSDNYYYTKAGRQSVQQAFSNNGIQILTAAQAECIDHIALSEKIVEERKIAVVEWNQDKSLSDHKGICVNISTTERD